VSANFTLITLLIDVALSYHESTVAVYQDIVSRSVAAIKEITYINVALGTKPYTPSMWFLRSLRVLAIMPDAGLTNAEFDDAIIIISFERSAPIEVVVMYHVVLFFLLIRLTIS